MLRRLAALLTAALLLASPALAADADATTGDIRCMIVLAEASHQNAQMEAAAPMLMIYFLGKIKGREPGLDLDKRLTSEFLASVGKDLRSEAGRCSVELQAMSVESAGLAEHFKSLAKDEANK